ncbi:Transposase [Serratia marcescens]|nr:Transposase [Serratia marcescens]
MRKARFTEHQIITELKSVEAGRTVKDVCREAGISERSYYNWKAKYGGMEALDIQREETPLSIMPLPPPR